nr:MAG: hypothetical protein [Microvirus sp.]
MSTTYGNPKAAAAARAKKYRKSQKEYLKKCRQSLETIKLLAVDGLTKEKTK